MRYVGRGVCPLAVHSSTGRSYGWKQSPQHNLEAAFSLPKPRPSAALNTGTEICHPHNPQEPNRSEACCRCTSQDFSLYGVYFRSRQVDQQKQGPVRVLQQFDPPASNQRMFRQKMSDQRGRSRPGCPASLKFRGARSVTGGIPSGSVQRQAQ